MSVLMSESFIDSFRNESIGCPYEWATESMTHLINSKTWIHSVIETPLCVARRQIDHSASIANIFGSEIEQKQSIF